MTLLYDYGKLNVSHVDTQSAPTSTQEVSDIVKRCQRDGLNLRLRGSGHTFNGCSLPLKSEHLLRTHDLNWFHFSKEGTVDVGAGAMVWDVRDLIQSYGYEMPVYNGGWAGPSVGGYISAGGIGKGQLSSEHGGFWEHVESVKLVDMSGNVVTITSDDDDFRWIFGSCGQLGVVVEARLKILPSNRLAAHLYPMDAEGSIERQQEEDPFENDAPPALESKILYWFSLFASPEQEQSAWMSLLNFFDENSDVLCPEGGWAGPLVSNNEYLGYRYEVKFKNFNPPLVYSKAEDFLVLGLMSRFPYEMIADKSRIFEIESQFNELCLENNFHLYLQAENISNSVDREEYYGSSVYRSFYARKKYYDPNFMLNSGAFFRS